MAGLIHQLGNSSQQATVPPQSAAERATRSVFVGNIPYEATEEQLKEIFTQAGPVVSFRLVYDRETGKPKGYGFCEYQDIETAQSAMRNLNNYDFNGRPLRVGVAAGEQNKEDMKAMQQASGGPPVENPYGEEVEPEKAPEAISKAVASLPPEQMFELMKQMKLCIQNNPNEARNMLLQNPQLAYALLQAQIVMKIVDPQVAMAMLHRDRSQIPPLLPPGGQGDQPMQVGGPQGPPQGAPQGPSGPGPRGPPMPVPMPGQPQMVQGGPPQMQPMMQGGPQIMQGGPQMMQGGPQIMQGGQPQMIPGQPQIIQGGQPQMMPGGPPMQGNMGIRNMMGDRQEPPMGGPGRSMGPGDMGPRDMGPRDMGPRDMGPRGQFQEPMRGPRPEVRDPRTVMGESRNMAPRVSQQGAGLRLPSGMSQIPTSVPSGTPISAQDQEKAALIMQVLQLTDQQIAMLPPEQRQSILILKDQIAKSQS